MSELTELEFIAQLVNQRKAIADGYQDTTLWLVTNKEHQAECLKEAKEMFENWKENELKQKSLREGVKTNQWQH